MGDEPRRVGAGGPGWAKSSTSGLGNCVEVRVDPAGVRVRHSQAPAGPVLRFTDAEWRAFLAGVRNGEFDLCRRPVPVPVPAARRHREHPNG